LRALISVYDKNGIEYFAGALNKKGWELVSTGGTHDVLMEAGLSPIKVSEVTGFPEILRGRVKTLHPKIFGAILADENQQEEIEKHGIERIDLVCCNLYPFQLAAERFSGQKNEDRVLENIDIGGVALLRAAAKNYKNVLSVTDPSDYGRVVELLENGKLDKRVRKEFAAKAFEHTASYDIAIRDYYTGSDGITVSMRKISDLRYGENPHQSASLYGDIPLEKHSGKKELSFNNYQDIESAIAIVKNFDLPATSIIKHTVPCGAAVSGDVYDSFKKAHKSDTMSAFGGVIGLNRELTEQVAKEISKNFFEVVAAPSFSKKALKKLEEKPNLRVVKYSKKDDDRDLRKITGGMLRQNADTFESEEWKTVTCKKPSEGQLKDLEFSWKIARFLKSNAIVIAKDGQTKGLGSGETARVMAVKIAIEKMKDFFPGEENLVMASDGFFPFPDAVEEASRAGVKAIVQPGGSKNDVKVIEAANKLGISMVFTGRRHFLH